MLVGDSRSATVLLALVLAVAASGCRTVPSPAVVKAPPAPAVCAPRELSKSALPDYRIEPPDVLAIDAVYLVPRPPYHLRTFDVLQIQVQGTLPDLPIDGFYRVEPGGLVKLGYYGAVPVAGLTCLEAETAITNHLCTRLKQPMVAVTLADFAGKQQIAGNHLVAPDGMVTLGSYGRVPVAGLTIDEARNAIQQFLSQYLESPEISLDVFAYNSKVYYLIVQGAGLGDGVYRFPVTGNDTVLDAISQVYGLQQVSSKRIWVARATDDRCGKQILPVNWDEITAEGIAATNYQLMPGDRVFIEEDKLVAFDTGLAKVTAPLERIMGFTLLGTGTATRLSGKVLAGGGNPQSNF